jgi:hypothetical protein
MKLVLQWLLGSHANDLLRACNLSAIIDVDGCILPVLWQSTNKCNTSFGCYVCEISCWQNKSELFDFKQLFALATF